MPDPTKQGSSTSFDQNIWDETEQIIICNKIAPRDVVEDFILYYRRVNLARTLAQIEIFKKQIDIPGSIVECGVFKGNSLLLWAKLADIYCYGDTLKKVIGFDTFKGFPALSKEDGKPDGARGKQVGGWDASNFLSVLTQVIDIEQRDSMIPRFKRVELIQGDICQTIPEYVKENLGLRISLLHIDLDIYEPTLVALKYLYPLVVSGGVVLFDEYAMAGFPGESQAFDEYFNGKRPAMTKFPYISTPSGYFIKEG